jgi:vacuolar-type H+-ATPase subunit E/Vma4
VSDFRKIAEEAKRTSEARTAERRAKEQAELQENQRYFESRVTALRSLVVDFLKEALQACKESGVTAYLEDNFKTRANRYSVPPARIEFWCSGPGGIIAGGGYESPTSDRMTFEFGEDGASMRHANSAERLELTNDPRGAVAKALERVLQSYFQSVERMDALRRA